MVSEARFENHSSLGRVVIGNSRALFVLISRSVRGVYDHADRTVTKTGIGLPMDAGSWAGPDLFILAIGFWLSA